MPIQIYALITWTTRERMPVIESGVEEFLGRALPAIARRHGAHVIRLGIVPDHVHVLLSLPTRFDIPALVRDSRRDGTSRQPRRNRGRRTVRWATGLRPSNRQSGSGLCSGVEQYLRTRGFLTE